MNKFQTLWTLYKFASEQRTYATIEKFKHNINFLAKFRGNEATYFTLCFIFI